MGRKVLGWEYSRGTHPLYKTLPGDLKYRPYVTNETKVGVFSSVASADSISCETERREGFVSAPPQAAALCL